MPTPTVFLAEKRTGDQWTEVGQFDDLRRAWAECDRLKLSPVDYRVWERPTVESQR
jgi:hypothetical protein